MPRLALPSIPPPAYHRLVRYAVDLGNSAAKVGYLREGALVSLRVAAPANPRDASAWRGVAEALLNLAAGVIQALAGAAILAWAGALQVQERRGGGVWWSAWMDGRGGGAAARRPARAPPPPPLPPPPPALRPARPGRRRRPTCWPH